MTSVSRDEEDGEHGTVLMGTERRCYGSIPRRQQQEQCSNTSNSTLHQGRRNTSLYLTLMALLILLVLVNAWLTPQKQSIPLLSQVYAPSIADSSTTFAQLAQDMVPAWYKLSESFLPIFDSDITPDKVFDARKTLLKTRDLLNIFAPVYSNDTHSNGDMWVSIKSMISTGYILVGEFQDLDHAHVLYTQEQLEELRNEVLQWRRDFDEFRLHHDAVTFLESPSVDGSYTHLNESHHFWKGVQQWPSGNDVASPVLRFLGQYQLTKAVKYLQQVYPYDNVLDEASHENYHNLRKQLRSLVDEVELFGNVMFPTTMETRATISKVTRAKKILGDINDDWTAYSIYVDTNVYPEEQTRLSKEISEAWVEFKSWVVESDIENAMRNVAQSMQSSSEQPKCSSILSLSHAPPSLDTFLQERKSRPTRSFVIGNEAGDADSIASAISLAYVESEREKTPIVSISKADFETLRPEINLLLDLAGIVNASNKLLFVDDPVIVGNAKVTLVDHNVMNNGLGDQWKVVEIVDHHKNEGQYLDTCSGSDRTIAFQHGKALVASTCTLVAERMQLSWDPPYPASLGILLLGTILLDSVHMSPEVGKVTQRDHDAIHDLLTNTNWKELTAKARNRLGIRHNSQPQTTVIFQLLQDAKYDPRFWNSLSVQDALRLDYKEYKYRHGLIGVSTVLMPISSFVLKANLVSNIHQYMDEFDLDFFGIMFAFEKDGRLYRELALCGTDWAVLQRVDDYMFDDDTSPLDLKEYDDWLFLPRDKNERLHVKLFYQLNIEPSRKQIGPLLVQSLEQDEVQLH